MDTKTFAAKFPGTCAKTGKAIKPGDTISRNPDGKGYILASTIQSEPKSDPKGSKPCKVTPHNKSFQDHEHRGWTIRTYEYTGTYGHHRVAFVRRPDGSYLSYDELTAWHLRFVNDSGYAASNIAFNHARTAKHVHSYIDCEIDGVEHLTNKAKRFMAELRELGHKAFFAKYPECVPYDRRIDSDEVYRVWKG